MLKIISDCFGGRLLQANFCSVINFIAVNGATVHFVGIDEIREFSYFLSYVLEKQIFGMKFHFITKSNSLVPEEAGGDQPWETNSLTVPGLPVPEPKPRTVSTK